MSRQWPHSTAYHADHIHSKAASTSADTAPTQQIHLAYNQAFAAYNRDRQRIHTQKYLTKFLNFLKPQSHVLDLGCGAGAPVDDVILKRGHLLTGLDFSEQQLAQARRNCPTGEFVLRDLSTLQPNEYQVDGIVCLYTLFHLPRKHHARWLKTIATYLEPGQPLLISFGEKDFEGWHEFYGQEMWSSQFAPSKNRQLLAQAGFTIELDEIDRSNFEAHQIVLASKQP